MDPSSYYNSWWSNHNSNNSWHMDHHKNGTASAGSVNFPPPAHNMSAPPQLPLTHAMPVGQPLPAQPTQAGFMPPRPAHTGSPVPLTRPNVTPGINVKPPVLENSSLKQQQTFQDKIGSVSVSIKPSVTSGSAVLNTQNDGKSFNSPNEVGADKKAHQNVTNVQYYQSAPNQQFPYNVSQIPSTAQHQQPPPPPLSSTPIHVQNQSIPSNTQNVSVKPVSNNQLVNNDKQDTSKNQTPPVPALISIKQSLPATVPAHSPPKTTHENKTNSSNNAASDHKNTNNDSSSSADPAKSTKPPEQPTVNVSILPAKASHKPDDAKKFAASTNTVTIIPPKIQNQESPSKDSQKTIPVVGVASITEPTENGVTSLKSQNTINVDASVKEKISSVASSNTITKNTSMDTKSSTPLPVKPTTQPAQSVSINKPLSVDKGHSPLKSESLTSTVPVKSNLQPKSQPKSEDGASPAKASIAISPPQPQNILPRKSSPSKSNAPVNELTPAKKDGPSPKKTIVEEPKEEKLSQSSKAVKPSITSPLAGSEVTKGTPRRKAKISEESDASSSTDEVVPARRGRASKRKPTSPGPTSPPPDAGRRSKRARNPATIYQSPIVDPQARASRTPKATPSQERLVVFFKNEHVALRNAEGTYFICQIAQNVYKASRKIKIRWLSPTDESDPKCDTFKPDYYDITDFDCILSSVDMEKKEKGIYRLPEEEHVRVTNILQRAMDRDKGIPQQESELREDHPDGLDLSLYNDESQLKSSKKKSRKRGKSKEESDEEESDKSEGEEDENDDDDPPVTPPSKKRAESGTARQRGTRATPSTSANSTASKTPSQEAQLPASRRRVVRNFSSPRSDVVTSPSGEATKKDKQPIPPEEGKAETPSRQRKTARATRPASEVESKDKPSTATPASNAATRRRTRK